MSIYNLHNEKTKQSKNRRQKSLSNRLMMSSLLYITNPSKAKIGWVQTEWNRMVQVTSLFLHLNEPLLRDTNDERCKLTTVRNNVYINDAATEIICVCYIFYFKLFVMEVERRYRQLQVWLIEPIFSDNNTVRNYYYSIIYYR
jgi:hypothetical protein